MISSIIKSVPGGVVIAAILLGAFGATTGMIRARRAEKLAVTEAETARQVSDEVLQFPIQNMRP